MEKTPKQIMADQIIEATSKFKKETGVEVHNIAFPHRVSDRQFGDSFDVTEITEIKFELR